MAHGILDYYDDVVVVVVYWSRSFSMHTHTHTIGSLPFHYNLFSHFVVVVIVVENLLFSYINELSYAWFAPFCVLDFES